MIMIMKLVSVCIMICIGMYMMFLDSLKKREWDLNKYISIHLIIHLGIHPYTKSTIRPIHPDTGEKVGTPKGLFCTAGAGTPK
jgi:hypothetical protein